MRKSFKLENLDCANCAAKMEAGINELPGVNKASISFMTSKLMIDADAADEEALAARTDAIRAAPDSWAVTQGRLEAYREEIAPYVDLRLHPLLAGSQKRDDGVYARMLRAVCDYVEGGAALEDCLTRLENLAASVPAVP